jgi:glycosyltransferase involved in cell wall biosynthesis
MRFSQTDYGQQMSSRSVVHLTTSDMAVRYLLLDQLRYLASHGYDVSAICSAGPHADAVRAAGIPMRSVRLTRRISPLDDAIAFVQIVRLLRRLRPDVVHTHTPKASLLGQWAARVAGVRHRVHTIHGLYFPGHMRPGRRWFYAWLERLQMMPAHIVLSQNSEDLATATREHLCDPRRLRYLGNGIDLERFHPRNREGRAATRASIGVAPDRLLVGMVGRLVREKGYLELFEAAAAVRDALSDGVTFAVIGGAEPGKADALTDEDVGRWKLGDSLRLLGHRDDLPALVGAMDVLVLPSHREGFPRVLMEAAATGLPTVATDIRGCREAVVDGVTGILVPLRDPSALAAALLRLLRDPSLRDRYGAAARRLAEERFDQRIVFERVAAAYIDLGVTG